MLVVSKHHLLEIGSLINSLINIPLKEKLQNAMNAIRLLQTRPLRFSGKIVVSVLAVASL